MAREAMPSEWGRMPRPAVRVYYLFVPRMATKGVVLHSILRPLLAFGIGIGWLILAVAMKNALQPGDAFHWSALLTAVGLTTVAVVTYASAAFAALRRFITPPLRYTYRRLRRLDCFLRDRRASRRFPHRVLEREMLRARLTARPSRAARKMLLPGTAVLVGSDSFWIERRDQSFEPIDVTKDDEALAWLGVENWERHSKSAAMFEPDGSPSASNATQPQPEPRGVRGWRKHAVNLLAVFGLCAGMYGLWFAIVNVLLPGLSHLARGRISFYSLLVFTAILAFLLCAGFSLIRPRHLVLIPGGLVRVVRWAWQPNARFHQFRAAESVLLIDSRIFARIDVLSGSAKARFDLNPELVPGLLAGWLSMTPPPTDAQLSAWFGEPSVRRERSTMEAG